MTGSPFEALAGLDRLIHEPARLAILTALSACESADFLSLRSMTGLSDGNLSTHVSKLEEAGLVEVEKQFVNKKPSTRIRISARGAQAIQRHWEQLASIKKDAEEWKKNRQP
jgi:DNA-binding transcriptional ArsR family regulator